MLFSVVIPAFNAGHYLVAALDSVFAQGFSDFEVIVVDDGSTDDTPALLAKYILRQPNCRVLRQTNTGPGGARNVGVQTACGEFIYFFDADDLVEPTLLSRIAERIRSTDADVYAFEASTFGDDHFGLLKSYARPKGFDVGSAGAFFAASVVQARWVVSPCCFVFRRSLLLRYPFRSEIYYEDLELFNRLFGESDATVVVMHERLFRRRIRAGSIMASRKTRRHAMSAGAVLLAASTLSFCALPLESRRATVSRIIDTVAGDFCRIASDAADQWWRWETIDVLKRSRANGLNPPRAIRYAFAALPEYYRIKNGLHRFMGWVQSRIARR